MALPDNGKFLSRIGLVELISLIKTALEHKYDKTGGRINGDVEIGDDHYFQMIADEGGSEEEQDYYKDVVRVTASTGNYGPQLTLVSRQEDASVTQTNCLISGVQTPHNATDAANKQYVDSNIKLPKYYSMTLNDDRTIQYGMSNAYSIISQDLINGYEVYLKVWYKDNYFICPLSGYHAETHGWITFDGVCILDGERWQPSIWVDSQNTWHIENKVDEITKNWVVDQFGAHVVWTGSLVATENKARNPSWHITGLNLSPYKYILCYIQGCKGTNNDQEGSGHAVRVDLCSEMLSPRSNMYIGGLMTPYPQDNGVKYGSSVVVSQDKTSVNFHYNFANTTGTTCLDRDGKLVKIEGYKN